MDHPHTGPTEQSATREGLITGMIGAAVVALFFLGVDLIRGTPGLTPSVLGEVFVLRHPSAVTNQVDVTAAVLWTIVHLISFAGFGLATVALARKGLTSSIARYAVVPLFLSFLIFFWGVLAAVDEATRGLFPVWSVLTANILAAAAMGWYLWQGHPELRRAFADAPLGAPAEPAGQ